MENKITIIEKEIENINFKLTVDPTAPDRTIEGTPILYINNEPHMIYAVDTLRVIKTIATAQNLTHVQEGVEGHWCEESICETCNKHEPNLK